jgi:hypothetical protein
VRIYLRDHKEISDRHIRHRKGSVMRLCKIVGGAEVSVVICNIRMNLSHNQFFLTKNLVAARSANCVDSCQAQF